MYFIDLLKQYQNINKQVAMRINKILNSGKYIMGPEVFELEEKLANFVGVKYCISCSSGTDALLIPLLAMGIGRGDAVITTPFTYIASGLTIRALSTRANVETFITITGVDSNSTTYVRLIANANTRRALK